MRSRLLPRLLHLANAAPPFRTQEFYEVKDRLLDRYATPDGAEWQHILRRCWGSYEEGCTGAKCRRCHGTGVYSERWILLYRFRWHGYVFHRPGPASFRRPEAAVAIEGRIDHAHRGHVHAEAALWLYLLTGEWRKLWHLLRGQAACGWYAWPLLNVQRVVMRLSMWLARGACSACGQRFFVNRDGSLWFTCRPCRSSDVELDEVPF